MERLMERAIFAAYGMLVEPLVGITSDKNYAVYRMMLVSHYI